MKKGSFLIIMMATAVIIGKMTQRFATWVWADGFRLYTLITAILVPSFLMFDRNAAIITALIWAVVLIVLKIKGMWWQIFAADTLTTGLFAAAAFLGGVPGVHNPLTASIATVIFFSIGVWFFYETFVLGEGDKADALKEATQRLLDNEADGEDATTKPKEWKNVIPIK